MVQVEKSCKNLHGILKSNCIRFLRKNCSSERVNSFRQLQGKGEGLKQLNLYRISDRNYISARKEEWREDGKQGSVTHKATTNCRHKWTEHVTDGGQKFLTDTRKAKVKSSVKNGTNHGYFNGNIHRFQRL
jgi:hypothetical protein